MFLFEQLLLVSLNVFGDTLLEPHFATKSTVLLFAKNESDDQSADLLNLVSRPTQCHLFLKYRSNNRQLYRSFAIYLACFCT